MFITKGYIMYKISNFNIKEFKRAILRVSDLFMLRAVLDLRNSSRKQNVDIHINFRNLYNKF
jgi:hypothetical protein